MGAHDHGHSHGHSHHHHPAPARLTRAYALGIGLNAAFVLAEVAYGIRANSLALIADAAHNAGDVLGLVLAWWTAQLAQRAATPRHTYGLGRSTIFSALANAGILVLGIGALMWEAVQRLTVAHEVQGRTVMVIAAIGVAVNAITAFFFFADRKSDLNVRAAFVHLASDALIALGVVISGAVMLTMHWYWIDPVVSLVIALLLLWGTWGLTRESLRLALDGVPDTIDPEAVRAYLAQLPDVEEIHDLHIWAMSTTQNALTAHLVMCEVPQDDALLQRVSAGLHERFGIDHMTIQYEHSDSPVRCAQTHHASGGSGR